MPDLLIEFFVRFNLIMYANVLFLINETHYRFRCKFMLNQPILICEMFQIFIFIFTWRWRPYSVDSVVLSSFGCHGVASHVAVDQDSSWHQDDGSFAWIACDSSVSAADYIHLQEVVIFPTSKYLKINITWKSNFGFYFAFRWLSSHNTLQSIT